MTEEKKQPPRNEPKKKDKFQEEFEALPLEKKITSLFKMEVVTLSETLSYMVNSPLKVVEKVGDAIADFGAKIENEARKAARSKETASGPKTPKGTSAKSKSSGKTPPHPPVG